MTKLVGHPDNAIQRLLLETERRLAQLERGTIDKWHELDTAGEPAIQSPWVKTTTVAGFRKYEGGGLVLLRGTLFNAAAGGVMFTFPVGYRPGRLVILGGAAPLMSVDTNGDATGLTTNVRMDGFFFLLGA